MNLAGAAVHKPNLTSDDLNQFVLATKGVRFLFNKSVEDYCNEVHKEAGRMIRDNRELERLPVRDDRTTIAKRFEERQKWFIDQFDKGIPKQFGPFLQIRG